MFPKAPFSFSPFTFAPSFTFHPSHLHLFTGVKKPWRFRGTSRGIATPPRRKYMYSIKTNTPDTPCTSRGINTPDAHRVSLRPVQPFTFHLSAFTSSPFTGVKKPGWFRGWSRGISDTPKENTLIDSRQILLTRPVPCKQGGRICA